MEFEWEPASDEANRFKHGVPLAFGKQVFDDPLLDLIPTIRIGDEDERWKAIGLVDGKLYTAIHVWREEVVRLISVRRSNAGVQAHYDRNSG
jgi:uncharacterized protein